MIIQISILRDEKVLLKEIIPLWKKYADGFVFFDDCSTDGTYEFLMKNQEKYNIIKIFRGNPNRLKSDIFTKEKELREPLFREAIKYSNKIITLDADEYLDGPLTKLELETILDNNPDTLIYFRWVQYTSCNTIRIDGPWKNNWKNKAGCFTKSYDYLNEYSHINQLPPTGKQISISDEKLFVAHLQWLDKTNVALKQYSYKVYDWIYENIHKIKTAGSDSYNNSVSNFDWEEEYFDCPLKIKKDIYEDRNIFENFRLNFIQNKTKQYNLPNMGDWGTGVLDFTPMYFCTAADEKHYPLLQNLIGSIHKFHFYELIEISVYDLGLSEIQKNELKNMKKIKICEIEKTNPQILELIETNSDGRKVRGLFSWKPVIIKQVLEKYPYVLYLDAGTTIRKPIRSLFRHIIENGYFFTNCGHSIRKMTTEYIKDKFKVSDQILNKEGIDAGFFGISKKEYNKIVKPVYEMCFDIKNFVDDGSCPGGYGCGRHDQTLFSINVNNNNLKINIHDKIPEECFVEYENKKEPLTITHTPSHVTDRTHIFRSRWNLNYHDYKILISSIKRKYVVSVITGIGTLDKYKEFIYSYFEDILKQIMFHRIEFIIVYSEWCDIFNKYSKFENIIFIPENKKLGVYNAWNIGISYATSEFITNWNVDDRRHPINIKIKHDMLKLNNEVDLVYNYYTTTSTGENFSTVNITGKKYLEFPDNYHKYVMTACLTGPDPMWRKSIHNFIGMFDYQNYPTIGDWEMWIRFAKFGCKFKLIPEILCLYGDHPNTISNLDNDKVNNQKQILYNTYKNVLSESYPIVFKEV